jgi:serine/threonine-protein kinase
MSALLKVPDLAKYELLEEIGHGGMATVYRARDRRLGREVAIKLIHRHLRDNPEVGERFTREATAVAKLRHPNIVEVFDVSDIEESERYLVVELVRGMTLREKLRHDGPLLPEIAAAVACEVGLGLEHAHHQGVIHRDVKPENVLIELSSGESSAERPGIRVKLTDFGIAKLLDAQGVTSTGQVLGSPAHMAPEQIDGRLVDARTDVFALGVLLYESMAGKLPFGGEHPAQVLRRVLDGEFLPPERHDAKIGASYSRLITRALARDPAQRFPSVQALVDALRAELASLGFTKLQPLLDAIARPDPTLPETVVERLVARGSQARADGRIASAADHFGRALAYRPGDRQLLRRVSGLERDRQLRRLGRWAGAGILLGGLGFAAYAQFQSSEPMAPVARERREPEPAAPLPSTGAVPPTAAEVHTRTGAQTAPVAPASEARQPPVVRQPPVRRPPADPEPTSTREVVVRIYGATGGILKIDGQPLEWFGDVRHALTLGPHHFEFLAPDNTCCQSTSRTVTVVAGEGPQEVIGDIPFVDATLRVGAEEGRSGLLSCPTLFSGEHRFPPERRVAMSRGKANGTCTLRAEETGSPLQKTEVSLRAGQTTVIPWP